MRLTTEQQAMARGADGAAVAWAMAQQIEVGRAFGAGRLIPVNSVHAGAEIGTMGHAGLAQVQALAAQGAKVRVPSSTAACSVDFARSASYGVSARQIEQERLLHEALRGMGFLDVATCINYQTLTPPRFGEHLGWGDTGAVAFANGVCGARSNYEGGPAALAAALTGLAPDYGYHLPEARLASDVFVIQAPLRDTADWSALGALVGSALADYWRVPVLLIEDAAPTTDQLKHFAAAAASFGSLAMFHIVGVTPEAPTLAEACGGRQTLSRREIGAADLAHAFGRALAGRALDLVVFSAPQLSLHEVQHLLALLDGRRTAPGTRLILTVNPQTEQEMRRLGLLDRLQGCGGELLSGTCFYVMAPRQVRQHLNVRTLLTPSAKLVNILSGAGYEVALAPVATCIEAAVSGVLP